MVFFAKSLKYADFQKIVGEHPMRTVYAEIRDEVEHSAT